MGAGGVGSWLKGRTRLGCLLHVGYTAAMPKCQYQKWQAQTRLQKTCPPVHVGVAQCHPRAIQGGGGRRGGRRRWRTNKARERQHFFCWQAFSSGSWEVPAGGPGLGGRAGFPLGRGAASRIHHVWKLEKVGGCGPGCPHCLRACHLEEVYTAKQWMLSTGVGAFLQPRSSGHFARAMSISSRRWTFFFGTLAPSHLPRMSW